MIYWLKIVYFNLNCGIVLGLIRRWILLVEEFVLRFFYLGEFIVLVCVLLNGLDFLGREVFKGKSNKVYIWLGKDIV